MTDAMEEPAGEVVDGARCAVAMTVNGKVVRDEVEARLLLVDYLRHKLGLTGTHVGCAHGVCGACTVLIDGRTARSCLTFAAQADGMVIETVEGLAPAGGALSPVQEAFRRHHALQCGYCTPGMLMTTIELLRENPHPTEDEVRARLAGNLCRCTGYVNIVRAILSLAEGAEDA